MARSFPGDGGCAGRSSTQSTPARLHQPARHLRFEIGLHPCSSSPMERTEEFPFAETWSGWDSNQTAQVLALRRRAARIPRSIASWKITNVNIRPTKHSNYDVYSRGRRP